MLAFSPIETRKQLSQAIAHALVEQARLLQARSRRLIEQASELTVEARAIRAQRAFIQGAGFAPRPSGT